MQQTTAFIFILTALLIYILYREFGGIWKAHRKEKVRRINTQFDLLARAIAAMSKLTDAIEHSSTDSDKYTKALDGTMAACGAIAQTTVELRETIESFVKVVAPRDHAKAYPEDNIMGPADDYKAGIAAETFSKILAGMPPHLAEQEAADDEEKKTMLSSISLGMDS